MVWEIDKAIDFCYGHRVWSQQLNSDLAGDMPCQCRHLHGHQGRVKVFLSAPALERGMVTDFNHLNWLKKFIDENIDHKFIIDKNDPMFESMTKLGLEFGQADEQAVQEYQGSFFVVDFVPTSENLAKFIFDLVQERMAPLGVKVSKVEWYETPKSRSVYKATRECRCKE